MHDARQSGYDPIQRPCPVCGSSRFVPHWHKGDLRIVRCLDCPMVFANPAPTGMATGEFYDTEGAQYYLSPAKLESDYADVRFARELKLFREFCPRGAVLDVGCGSGGFLFQVKKRWPADYEILGTDVSGPPLDYAESRGVPVARGNFLEINFDHLTEKPTTRARSPSPPSGDLSRLGSGERSSAQAESPRGPSERERASHWDGVRGRFDLITLWAVTEHLGEPKKFLQHAHSLLKPGGLCIVLVPNLRSLATRLLGQKYRYVYPQHLNYFSASTLSRLLTSSGFEIVTTRYTHFNPVVIWQDFRSGGRDVSNQERGDLLKRTTSLKQKPWMQPVKWSYSLAEKILATFALADNLVIVARRRA